MIENYSIIYKVRVCAPFLSGCLCEGRITLQRSALCLSDLSVGAAKFAESCINQFLEASYYKNCKNSK